MKRDTNRLLVRLLTLEARELGSNRAVPSSVQSFQVFFFTLDLSALPCQKFHENQYVPMKTHPGKTYLTKITAVKLLQSSLTHDLNTVCPLAKYSRSTVNM